LDLELLSYTQRLTYEDNNKTLAGCLQPIRMTTIIWKLLKMSKYPYDNDNLYQLTDKSETPLISSYLLLSQNFVYVCHTERDFSRYCGSLLKFRM